MVATRLAVLLVVLLGLLVPVSADAQALFGGGNLSGEYLTAEDIQLQNKAGVRLLETGKDGDTSKWSNPESKSYGTITLREAFERDGMKCRKIEMLNTPKGRTDQRVWYKHAVCLVPGKGWRYLY